MEVAVLKSEPKFEWNSSNCERRKEHQSNTNRASKGTDAKGIRYLEAPVLSTGCMPDRPGRWNCLDRIREDRNCQRHTPDPPPLPRASSARFIQKPGKTSP